MIGLQERLIGLETVFGKMVKSILLLAQMFVYYYYIYTQYYYYLNKYIRHTQIHTIVTTKSIV